jgi:hypothetical protein
MLRMSLRDPRVSKAVQVAFVAMSALWLVNFSTQETHSKLGIATSEYRSPRWIFVSAVARHPEAHRVEAAALTSIRCLATKAEPRERRANILVTKMVTNTGPRAGIERDGTARAADFRNTNQHLSGQNKTGRDDRQQISSAVLSIKPRTANASWTG